MNIEIRISIPEELPRLTEIYNEAVLNSVATFDTEPKTVAERKDWFDLHQDPRYPLVSALINDMPVGWGTLSPFHPRPAYNPTSEFSVYVDKDFRGKGVGRAILRDLLTRAKTLQYHSVIGMITGSNVPSLTMAKSIGFTQVGYYREVGRKFGAWQDVAVVQLFLD